MSVNLWKFSPSSEPYLQRCIAAAPLPDPNNKWFQKFGMKVLPIVSNITEKTANILENQSLEVEKDATISYEDFFDTIDSETTLPIEYVMKKCRNDPALINKMAEKLPNSKVEQLFKHILSKNVDSEFRKILITNFLPIHIKIHNSRLSIDFLLQLNEGYPLLFMELLEILMNDTEISNQVLNNYIAALNDDSLSSFMQTLTSIKITSKGFMHNVLVIYTAYKDCIKNELTQNYIETMINQHSKCCKSDRNFGRLFLTFLQSEKGLERKVSLQIQECLENHRSPFKRPCTMLLKDIIQ